MMADGLFDNPLVMFLIVGVVFIVLIMSILKKRNVKFKEFKLRKVDETLNDDLKKSVDLRGQSVRRYSLLAGFQKIARIERYLIEKGKFSKALYDPESKDIFVDDTASKDYELIILRAKSNNFVFRMMGIKKIYFVLKYKSIKGQEHIIFDHFRKQIVLPYNMQILNFGNVWINSNDSLDYINEISIRSFTEDIMMHLENIPDKAVHLELEQAKKERTGRVYVDLEKGKWENRKDAGDTSITEK